MGESIVHMKLVDKLFIAVQSFVPKDSLDLVYLDKPESIFKPPRTMHNFVPDMYYCHENKKIIGEAKTSADLEKNHSREQFSDYIDEIYSFGPGGLIIFAVPWQDKGTLKNDIRFLMCEKHKAVDVYVTTDMGDIEKI